MITGVTYASDTDHRRASIARMGPRSWLVTFAARGPIAWSDIYAVKVRSLARAQAYCRGWVDGTREVSQLRGENNC